MTASAFGELLRRHRQAAGLSQRDLAVRCGLSDRAIRALELGTVARPRWHSVRAVGEALGLTGEELTRFLSAARSPQMSPAPVAAGVTSGELVGRAAELRALAELVVAGRRRLITLVGLTGVGKSRLAAELASVLPQRAGLDTRTLDLSAVTDADLVPELIAAAVGVDGASRLGPLDRIAAQVRDARLLLILDRFERLLPAAAGVRELVRRCGGMTVLATSQVPLGVDGEHVVRLGPLPVPATGPVPAEPGELAAVASVRLLAQRAAVVRPDFAVTASNGEAVAAICRKVDGLPLALELAAARLRVLSPAELADRLDRQLEILTGGARGLPERHRSLRAAIESALAVAAAESRELFAWFAAFAGGARLADLEQIVRGLGADQGWLMAALDGLAESGLMRSVDEAGETRYTLPDAMAELAAERLSAHPDRSTVHRTVSLHYLDRLAQYTTKPSAARSVAGRDSDNVRAALAWVTVNDPSYLDPGRLQVVERYYSLNGRFGEGQALLERVAAAGVTFHGHALIRAGYLATLRQDTEAAEVLAGEGMRHLDPTDVYGRIRGHHTLGCAAKLRKDPATAYEQLSRALAYSRNIGDPHEVGKALHNLAVAAIWRGDTREAQRLLVEALAVERAAGAPEVETGNTLSNLAEIALDAGDLPQALDYGVQAASSLEACGYHRLAAVSHAGLGVTLMRMGDVGAALDAADRAAGLLAEAHEDYAARAVVTLRRSVVLHAAGKLTDAAQELQSVLTGLAGTGELPIVEELGSVLEHHADLLAGRDAVTAARLLGAADRCRRSRNHPVTTSDRTVADRAAAACEAVLTSARFQREYEAGARLGWLELAASGAAFHASR